MILPRRSKCLGQKSAVATQSGAVSPPDKKPCRDVQLRGTNSTTRPAHKVITLYLRPQNTQIKGLSKSLKFTSSVKYFTTLSGPSYCSKSSAYVAGKLEDAAIGVAL